MSQRYDLSGIAGNDLSFDFTLTADGAPLDLAGLTITVYLKASPVTPDTLAATFTTSAGLTVTGAADGQFTWALPHAAYSIDAPGSLWYRADVESAGTTETAMYGTLWLTAA